MNEALLRAFIYGVEMDREKAMNIPSLAGAILKIADTVAAIPIKLYKRNGDKNEVVEDERTVLLNEDTGDTLDGYQFKHALIMDYFLGKGGYAYINKNGRKIESLHYVKESNISFQENTDVIFKDYRIMVQGNTYDPEDWIRLLRNTEDGIRGKSIIEENKESLSVAYTALKFEKNLVSKGGNKKGFLKSERRLKKEQMDELKAAWRELYSNNGENVVILNEGMEFKEASNTSVEMQLNENKKTNGIEVCKIVGTPPAMIEGKATERDEKIFIKYEINNVLKALETAINRAMLLETEKGEYYFEADTDDLNRSDIEKRYAAYGTGIEKGFLQVDEVRKKEKMPQLGVEFIKLGLNDGLLDPVANKVYVLNTNKTIDLNKLRKGEEVGELNLENNPSSLTDTSMQSGETAGQSGTEEPEKNL